MGARRNEFAPSCYIHGRVPVYDGPSYEFQGLAGLPAAPPSFLAENKSGGVLAAGSPAATHASGIGVIGASAADNSKPAVGLVQSETDDGFSATVVTDGPFEMEDWTDVVGAANLIRGPYFLSETAGRLTAVPPTSAGRILQRIGYAVSPTTMQIEIAGPILL